MKAKYTVTMTYSEKGGAHRIVETWDCGSDKKLKQVLAEALDLVKDTKGNPKEPDLEEMKKNILPYADEKFVKQEFRRQKKAYGIYLDLIARVDFDEPGFVETEEDIDRWTTIVIEEC